MRCKRGFEEFAAALRDAEGAAEQSLCGGGAEADDDFGFQQRDFGVEPRATGGNFGAIWLLVDATFAARFPFEMFNGIGEVSFGAVSRPACSSAVSRSFPAGPTNGLPC